MNALLALWKNQPSGWDIADWLCFILVVVGIVAVFIVVIKVCGWDIPAWVWRIVGIVLAVFVGILAIRFLASM